ncbi:MAG: hypothetical protein AB7K24_08895 [Gemmataceae bacterium]
MQRHLSFVVVVLAVVLSPLRGAEPEQKQDEPKPAEKKAEKKGEEAAPAPRTAEPEIIVLPYYHQRINRYDVWQKVAVSHSDQWRPRVINSPYGAYYLYNGKPYPWLPVRQTNVIATSVGTPYRAAPARMPYCED